MMAIHQINQTNWHNAQKQIILFILKHGEGRITHKAIRWLKNLQPHQLHEEGTSIVVATDKNMITGICALTDYGRKESLVVVHKDYRQKRVALDLMETTIAKLHKAYGRVALDNIPSLHACFALGMVAFKLIDGPTGKPTLWFGIGNWTKDDVQ